MLETWLLLGNGGAVKDKWRRWRIFLMLLIGLSGLSVWIAFLPGPIEGVYYPITSYGCACDQFTEWRDGRLIDHVMDSDVTLQIFRYSRNPSGEIVMKSSDDLRTFAIVEPHLLFISVRGLESGKSNWRMRRFVTPGMKKKMENAHIRKLKIEPDGVSDIIYDFRFNVIKKTFRTRRTSSK